MITVFTISTDSGGNATELLIILRKISDSHYHLSYQISHMAAATSLCNATKTVRAAAAAAAKF